MVNQKKSKITALWQTAVILLIASCAPIETTPATIKPLSPPVVQVTHAPTVDGSRNDAPTSTSWNAIPTYPTQMSIHKPDIARMADEIFGTRQIRSISIPALSIESEVVPVGWRVNFSEDLTGGKFEWDSPDENVGWVITSALPDETGNIVLYGHNNIYGKVFQNLYKVKEGDKVYLQTQEKRREYEARYILLLPILGASEEQVRSYQKYLQPTADARVTIISCWPPQGNTHRVVVIAKLSENQP